MGGGGSKQKKKGGKVTSHDQAVLDLKVQRDKLRQYQKRCEKVMDKETEMAKKLVLAGKKKQALMCLKKKKLQTTMFEKAQAQLENVSTMIDSIEFSQMEANVFESLKSGNAALKQLHEQIGSIDEIEDLMLDTEEAIAHQNEIDEALGASFAAEGLDEADIIAELEALEMEESGIETALPDAPTHDLPQVEQPQVAKSKAKTQKTAVLA